MPNTRCQAGSLTSEASPLPFSQNLRVSASPHLLQSYLPMFSYTLLHVLYALDPIQAPWPVALFMLLAALFLGWRLWRMLWRGS
jgi:hypothetical protein